MKMKVLFIVAAYLVTLTAHAHSRQRLARNIAKDAALKALNLPEVISTKEQLIDLTQKHFGSTPYFSDTSYLNRLHKSFLTM